jgi:hypothetical protein
MIDDELWGVDPGYANMEFKTSTGVQDNSRNSFTFYGGNYSDPRVIHNGGAKTMVTFWEPVLTPLFCGTLGTPYACATTGTGYGRWTLQGRTEVINQVGIVSPLAIDGWHHYVITKVANGSNGCANSGGCWQKINAADGTVAAPMENASSGTQQDVGIFGLPANGYVRASRYGVNTACTVSSGNAQVTALGPEYVAWNYYGAITLDLTGAAGTYKDVPMSVTGSASQYSVYPSLSVVASGNVSGIAAGCAIDVWVNWSILP